MITKNGGVFVKTDSGDKLKRELGFEFDIMRLLCNITQNPKGCP